MKCSEKGCVFPVDTPGLCDYHRKQFLEPAVPVKHYRWDRTDGGSLDSKEDRKELAIEMLRAGKTTEEVGDVCHLSGSVIKQLRDEAGVPTRRRASKYLWLLEAAEQLSTSQDMTIKTPDDRTVQQYANVVRAALLSSKRTLHERWSIRQVDGTRTLQITKLGPHQDKPLLPPVPSRTTVTRELIAREKTVVEVPPPAPPEPKMLEPARPPIPDLTALERELLDICIRVNCEDLEDDDEGIELERLMERENELALEVKERREALVEAERIGRAWMDDGNMGSYDVDVADALYRWKIQGREEERKRHEPKVATG